MWKPSFNFMQWSYACPTSGRFVTEPGAGASGDLGFDAAPASYMMQSRCQVHQHVQHGRQVGMHGSLHGARLEINNDFMTYNWFDYILHLPWLSMFVNYGELHPGPRWHRHLLHHCSSKGRRNENDYNN